ncbi:DHA1 family bicyclomycin/chloramphenicol resistance-like MFS transporter [Cellulosimicrobium cellulans J34]|nr:DHA1 family bicyclomycin/chloramphenicol resistance-like MFS transporter [Cellulosimicrobium cellulans J34]SMF15119.1 MFS transporter, DHA1 family, bicyclomycin/chloramphenicol resistance protein [Cellulosimicrobium cellulans J1]
MSSTPPATPAPTAPVAPPGTPSATSPAADRSGRISAGLVLLLSALTAVGPLTIDLYLSAFPRIVDELGTTESRVQLTLTATLAGLAIGQLLIGSVSDAVGRRAPLLVSLAVYVAASVGIVVAGSVAALTGLRFVQGLAAAAGMVLSMAIVRDSFEGYRIGKVIARLMLVVGVAPILAPTIGAQFLRFGSWRGMFVALAAVGALLFVVVLLRLRETLPAERRRSGGTTAALRSYGSLLGDWSFIGLALIAGFYMAAMFTYISASTFVFQDFFGMSAQQYAVVFGVGAVSVTAGSQINGALVGRVAPERILQAAVAAGFVLSGGLLVAALAGGGLAWLVPLIVLTLGTAGFVMPSVPAIALERNAHRAGSAAALIGAFQFGVGAVIAPVTGLLGGSPPVTMAAVMFGVIVVAGAVLLGLRRTFGARVPDDAADALGAHGTDGAATAGTTPDVTTTGATTDPTTTGATTTEATTTEAVTAAATVRDPAVDVPDDPAALAETTVLADRRS